MSTTSNTKIKVSVVYRGRTLGQGMMKRLDDLNKFKAEVNQQLGWLSQRKMEMLEFVCEGGAEGQSEALDPRQRWSDTDGGVFGVRFFNVVPSSSGRLLLISPTSLYVWLGSEGVAKDFRNEGAVRGHVGFHAAWPTDSLERWTDSEVDHHATQVKALVKGWGDLVLGEQGWRSEKLTIVSLQANGNIAKSLAESYPNVSIIVGEPTNERSGDFNIVWAGGREYAMGVVSPLKVRGRTLVEFKA